MEDQISKEVHKQQKLKDKELKRIIKKKKAELEFKVLEQKEKQQSLKEVNLIAKNKNESQNQEGRYGTKGEPRKALSTFFRNQNKLDVSLISILDRKASILIKISSTIISALVVFNDFISDSVDNGHLITIVLMIGLMITLVLAILATKPFVSRIQKIIQNEIIPVYPNLEENLFAGSQLKCSLEEYEQAMGKLVNSQDLQYGNQVRASYMIGQSNRFKSRLVDWAFNAFLISFLLVSLIYLFSRFF